MLNVKDMVNKFCNFAVKHMFVPGMVYTQIDVLEEVHEKLVSVC